MNRLVLRRVLEVLALVGALVVFIATSRAPGPCAVETLNVRANTTCGAEANVSLSSNTGCGVVAGGAAFGGLPGAGSVSFDVPDGGMGQGFTLSSFDADAGVTRTCTATPDGGVFSLSCRDCGGGGSCSEVCAGTLTPQ
ncbi:MAG: hypothetical protein U0228_10055 [Myxococcaceae bacterium]